MNASCQRCQVTFELPEMPVEARRTVARLMRDNQLVNAIRELHAATVIGLKDAKAATLHISRVQGQCQRCRRQRVPGASECPGCRCLNLDW